MESTDCRDFCAQLQDGYSKKERCQRSQEVVTATDAQENGSCAIDIMASKLRVIEDVPGRTRCLQLSK